MKTLGVLFFATLALVITITAVIGVGAIAQVKPEIAESPSLNPGETWTFKNSLGARQVRTFLKEENGLLVFEVIHTSPGKKPALYFFFLNRDLAFVKVMRGDGTEHRRFEPHGIDLRFPLYLGKNWTDRAQRFDQGKPGLVFVGTLEVVRVEEIEVAAGKFRAFRVEVQAYPEGDPTKISRYTNWYSPTVKAVVKIWEVDPEGRESTFELVEFRATEKRVQVR